LTANVQSKIQGDGALSTEPIQVSTQTGTVTLNGQVSNGAARTLAANDAAAIAGVQKVINNLVVAANTPAVSATTTTPQPEVMPLPVEKGRARVEARPAAPVAPRSGTGSGLGSGGRDEQRPAPVERAGNEPVRAAAPAVPAAPAFRNVTLAAGTVLPVRVTQTLDSATTQVGDTFSGAMATDIVQDGLTVLPRGTAVTGRVTDAKDAGHFKGSSLLAVQLTGINKRGQQIAVSTETFSKEGTGRGKNTAVKTGVGAAAGALLGGIFGGGKGAAIGAAAGGGTGAGINAVTRGQQVQIPTETVVRFSTTNAITVRTSTAATGTRGGDGMGGAGDRNGGVDRGIGTDRGNGTDLGNGTDRSNGPTLNPRQ